MKICFFLSANDNAVSTYSDKFIALGLKKMGYDIEIIQDKEDKLNILRNPNYCDAIFFQKTIQCIGHTKQYISHLKGKVRLIHIDDDFQDMVVKEHIDTLNITDLILVGTNQHRLALADYTDTPVEVFSCIVDIENYPYKSVRQKNNNPLIISWQQGCADAYVKEFLMIKEPLNALHEKYGIELHLFGWHMGKDYPDKRQVVLEVLPFSKCIEYQSIKEYLIHIVPQIAKSDIFIMPYNMRDKDRIGKSGFGLKRVMSLGIPVVATDSIHHRSMIENGVHGFLATTEEEWFDYIKALIEDVKLRERFSLNARNLIEEKYNEAAVLKGFISVVNKHFSIF
ncbi:MAG: hypothetical protein CVV02_04765 [Firmicutes bacterium HGW-Firmicutes-7]|nr:MAG: hypothetical protein CVV02_04765 [Firmicutes bacterium HGW-Firmicutes-7]